MNGRLMFVIVSSRDISFFGAIAKVLADLGYETSFLSLFDHGLEVLRDDGFEVFVPTLGPEADIAVESEIYFHEWYTFQRDPAFICRRYRQMLEFCEALFGQQMPDFVIQELGGFSFHHAIFNAALRSKVRHLCIEPSFFNGRYLLLDGCLTPHYPECCINEAASPRSKMKVDTYVDSYLNFKVIVKPLKDSYHFLSPLQKLLSTQKILSFFVKLKIIYTGKVVAFDYPFSQVRQSVAAVVNDLLLRLIRRPFGDIDFGGKQLFYFPLHAPKDVALTLREPELVDQVSLVEELARRLRPDTVLIIKEHPAFKGAIPANMLRRLVKAGIVLVKPDVNSFDIIKRSSGVITINSKAGMEALIQGVPVFAIGRPFYSKLAGVTRGGVEECWAWMHRCKRLRSIDRTRNSDSLAIMYEYSHPGELYLMTQENIGEFAQGFHRAISEQKFLV